MLLDLLHHRCHVLVLHLGHVPGVRGACLPLLVHSGSWGPPQGWEACERWAPTASGPAGKAVT